MDVSCIIRQRAWLRVPRHGASAPHRTQRTTVTLSMFSLVSRYLTAKSTVSSANVHGDVLLMMALWYQVIEGCRYQFIIINLLKQCRTWDQKLRNHNDAPKYHSINSVLPTVQYDSLVDPPEWVQRRLVQHDDPTGILLDRTKSQKLLVTMLRNPKTSLLPVLIFQVPNVSGKLYLVPDLLPFVLPKTQQVKTVA